MSIRVIVADDERYAREELIYLLGHHPDVDVVGEADSGDAAVMKTIELEPDVLFLDVEMPKMNGLEAALIANGLKKPPHLVFATAYPQFAADAFRVDAVDYLLKPYDEEQLQQTLDRIRAKRTQETVRTPPLGKLAIEQDGEIDYLPIPDILYVCREDNRTRIVTQCREYEVRLPLKELETRLVPFSFFRIHKSYLVNLLHVRRLSPWFNGAYQLELEGRKEQLSVSRNYAKALRDKLEQ
ncbi:DNA-binding response regulator [Sporosarcina sp. NCCP-2716]|uniref:LytR/AlgR family response regulator transcription factor n=1 Tax=Sporosarcina sp. NCCP-2716 TaxID=2943679 RepID=UPI00203D714B|nr:LytTR family DNA-binding domain-containing protein [Sporosarcina sp. NCCP-2716]GKV68360.1 DNA-binding response regulator [Sporosarcina sp. NCCP-2716]